MLKKRIKFVDYNGQEREEDFHFNINEAELTELNLRNVYSGGFKGLLEAIIEENDPDKITDMFKDIIKLSYGVRTAKGGFSKSEEEVREFLASRAYTELFMELIQDTNAAAAFVNGVMDTNVTKQADHFAAGVAS